MRPRRYCVLGESEQLAPIEAIRSPRSGTTNAILVSMLHRSIVALACRRGSFLFFVSPKMYIRGVVVACWLATSLLRHVLLILYSYGSHLWLSVWHSAGVRRPSVGPSHVSTALGEMTTDYGVDFERQARALQRSTFCFHMAFDFVWTCVSRCSAPVPSPFLFDWVRRSSRFCYSASPLTHLAFFSFRVLPLRSI